MDVFNIVKAAFKDLSEDNKIWLDKIISRVMDFRKTGVATAGYLMEPAIANFISEITGYQCRQIGKEWYRNSSENEDDIVVFAVGTADSQINEIIENRDFTKMIGLSLKTYGEGDLQVSTNKSNSLRLDCEKFGERKLDKKEISTLKNKKSFNNFKALNTIQILYQEPNGRKIVDYSYRVTAFNTFKACEDIEHIEFIMRKKYGIYRFFNSNKDFMFDIRYGGKSANALQRGVWTQTKKVSNKYLEELVSRRKYTCDGGFLNKVLSEITKK
ncbi:MAG: hypothetical protein ACOCP4_07330 [Candidatus Woesearchaeota archaeon]